MNEETGIIIWLDVDPTPGTIRDQADIVRFYAEWKDGIKRVLTEYQVSVTDLEATSGLIVTGSPEVIARISGLAFPDKTRVEQLDEDVGFGR